MKRKHKDFAENYYGICIDILVVLFASATFFVIIRVIVKCVFIKCHKNVNKQKANFIIRYIKWISIHILYLTEVSHNKNFTI